jgi:hypothetical protein
MASEPKPTSKATIVVAGVVFGGLGAVTVGQRFLPGAEGSQDTSLMLVAGGAVLGAIAGFLVARLLEANRG